MRPGILSCLYGSTVLHRKKVKLNDRKCLHLVSGIPGAGVFPWEEMALDCCQRGIGAAYFEEG